MICKEIAITVSKETAYCIEANFTDFQGDLDAWRKAYFALLSWKNSWGRTRVWKLDLVDGFQGPKVILWVRRTRRGRQEIEGLLELMEGHGYSAQVEETEVLEYSQNFEDPIEDEPLQAFLMA